MSYSRSKAITLLTAVLSLQLLSLFISGADAEILVNVVTVLWVVLGALLVFTLLNTRADRLVRGAIGGLFLADLSFVFWQVVQFFSSVD